MKKFSIEFKWAIITTIIFLAWMTLEKQLGFHTEKIKWEPLFNILYIFPLFLLYFLALREKKIKFYNGTMNWKQGIISAIVISFIIVVFSPIAQFILHEFISPNFLTNTINYTVESKKLSLEEAKEYIENFDKTPKLFAETPQERKEQLEKTTQEIYLQLRGTLPEKANLTH